MDVIEIKTGMLETLIAKIEAIADFVRSEREKQPDNEQAWMNDDEVCAYLNIGKKTLQRLRTRGEISFSTVGRNHFYTMDAVSRMLKRKNTRSDNERINSLAASHQARFLEKRSRNSNDNNNK